MYLEVIRDELFSERSCPIYIRQPKTDILFVETSLPKQNIPQPNTLYYVSATLLMKYPQQKEGTFMCSPEGAYKDLLLEAGNHNLILPDNKEEADALFQELVADLKQDALLSSYAKNVITSNISLKELIALSTDILGNPFIICDMGHNIIGLSDIAIENFAWNRFKELGYEPFRDDFADSFHCFLDKVKRGVYVDIEAERTERSATMRAALMSGSDLLGYLTVFALQKPFSKTDVRIIHLLANLIASELIRKAYLQPASYALIPFGNLI